MATIAAPARIKVAAVNFCPVYGDKQASLRKILSAIEGASAQGCDLIVLPEMALNSWFNCTACAALDAPCDTHLAEGEYRDGPVVEEIVTLARSLRVHVVVGFLERARDQDVLHNSVALIGPSGLIDVYRKLHLGVGGFTEGNMCRPGRDLGFYETELGPIGLGICFDIWLNPELSRIFALKGARLIIAPTAGLRTSEKSASDLRQLTFARARENLVFVVMANLVGAPGDPSDSVYSGGSVIAGPQFPRMADILAEADDTETMAIARIDFAQYDQFAELIPWREWRRTRNAAATELIAREYGQLARELAELEAQAD